MNSEETSGENLGPGTIPGWGSLEFSRRMGLKALGVAAAAGGVGALTDAAASYAATGSKVIKIGYVTPATGALASFAGPDNYVLKLVRASHYFAKGIKLGGTTYKIQIITADSQSSPSVAAQVTTQLIQAKGVDIIVTSSAPETTVPVSTVCEQAGIPCVSTVVPWEAWYVGLGGTLSAQGQAQSGGFKYCTTFFFGVPEFVECFLPMWNRIQKSTNANKVYAGMFPNDSDGNAFRAAFPPILSAMSNNAYKFIDGGAYTDLSSDYTSMIQTFKSAGADFFVNAPLPPDFNTFWKQAAQQQWRPKLATVAKVMLFPTDVYALGSLSNNVATDAWFTPYAPYKSSLTGMTANAFAAGYQRATGQQWVQSMGSTYSLFEVVIEALKKVKNPHDRSAVANALHHVNYSGITGPMNFNAKTNPAPGVAIIKPVGIQWKPGSKANVGGKVWKWSPYVVDNTLNKHVPLTGVLRPTNA